MTSAADQIQSSANFGDLQAVLRETLGARGVLDAVRATLRAEIFNALEDHDAQAGPASAAPATETLLLNELVREYLEYNGYTNSLSVFSAESGQPKDPAARLGRPILVHELGIPDSEQARRVPLLYSCLARLQNTALSHPPAPAAMVSSGTGRGGLRTASGASSSSSTFGGGRASPMFGASSDRASPRGSRAASPSATRGGGGGGSGRGGIPDTDPWADDSSDDVLEESYVSRSGREIGFSN